MPTGNPTLAMEKTTCNAVFPWSYCISYVPSIYEFIAPQIESTNALHITWSHVAVLASHFWATAPQLTPQHPRNKASAKLSSGRYRGFTWRPSSQGWCETHSCGLWQNLWEPNKVMILPPNFQIKSCSGSNNTNFGWLDPIPVTILCL